jgi:integrase
MSPSGSAQGPQGRIRKYKMPIKFSDRFIDSLSCPPNKKDCLVFDKDVKGLGLRITVTGNKHFLVQWHDRITHKKCRMPLGTWGSITLKDARDAAKIKLGEVAKGDNPIEILHAEEAEEVERQKELKLKLDDLIHEWEKQHLSQRSLRYKREAVRSLKRGFQEYLKLPAIRLNKKDVVDTLDYIAKYSGETLAARLCSYGRAMYQWALQRDKVNENPFEKLPFKTVKSQRERVLNDEEVGKVYKAATAIPYPFGPYHRLLALTGQRVNEVARMQWSEISKDHSTWTLPLARAKNKRGHIVHLNQPARDILKGIKELPAFNKKSEYVFTITGKTPISGFSKAKRKLNEASGVKDWVEHDWRRTLVTGLAAMGVDHIVADKLLNHQEGVLSSIARVYQKNDYLPERKEALDKWANHVMACASKVELPKHSDANARKPNVKSKKTNKIMPELISNEKQPVHRIGFDFVL